MAGGQVATFSQGTLLPDDGHGIAAEFFQGLVGLAVTVALVGSASTLAQGAATPNADGTVPLTGQASAVSTGVVSPEWPQVLSGVSIASGSGTLTLTIRPTDISVPTIASSAGTVVAEGAGGSVHLSGQEITSSPGDVVGGYQFITGIASTPAQTAPGIDLSISISGQAVSCSLGTVSPNQDAVDSLIESFIGNATPSMTVALSGSGLTGSQGAVTITWDSFIALTGAESTGQTGTITHEESFPISGESITSAQYNVGAPGGATLTGSAVSVIAGSVFTDNDRTYAITGQSITAQDGITFASSLAFAIGQQLDSSLQGIGPREATLSGISISVDQGAVSIPVVESVSTVTGGWPVPPRKKRRYEKPKQDEIDPAKARELAESQEKQEYLKRQEEHSKEVTRQIKELLDKQDLVNEYLRIEKEKDAEKEEEALLMLIALSR